jgi:hypothetical protein
VVRKVPIEKITQFDDDVGLLISKEYSITKIGEKIPKMGKGNFSGYVNHKKTITENFLAKFYRTWGDELERIKNKSSLGKEYSPETDTESPPNQDPEDYYRISDPNVTTLINGQNSLIKSNGVLAEANKIAAEASKIAADACKTLAETNRQLVEKLFG